MTASTSGSRTGGGDKNEIKKKIVIEARRETVPPWILWGSRMSKTSMVKFKMRMNVWDYVRIQKLEIIIKQCIA